MGFFNSITSPFVDEDDPNSGGFLTDVFDPFDFTGKRSANALAGQEAKAAALRDKQKRDQYDLLNSIKAPETSSAIKNRIRALEDESKTTSLAEDPYFQGQRSTLVQGGQQALSSAQNQQKAQGTSGGFSNQGSVNDIYDRLGTQLNQLGQQSTALKSEKADKAANMQQSILDNQREFDNSVVQARMAIEKGDAAAATAALNNAYLARQQIIQNQQQMAIGAVEMVGGAFTGNPMMAAGGASSFMGGSKNMQAVPQMANAGQGPTQANAQQSGMTNGGINMGGFGATNSKPWYQTR